MAEDENLILKLFEDLFGDNEFEKKLMKSIVNGKTNEEMLEEFLGEEDK